MTSTIHSDGSSNAISTSEITSNLGSPSLETGEPLSSSRLHHDDHDDVNHDASSNNHYDKAPTSPSTSLGSSSSSQDTNDTAVRPSPLTSLLSSLRRHKSNLTLAELSGSLGDLGTFIPLTVALARERKIALAPALFWAGVSNFVTGMMWDVPMCVQPMKSISAVALTEAAGGGVGLDAQSVTTAGILAGGLVLILGVTNLMEVVNWVVPMTVVCGLQVGVGLRLASKGMKDIQGLGWVGSSEEMSGSGAYDSIVLAIACSVLCMYWLRDDLIVREGTVSREANNNNDNRGQDLAEERPENEDAGCGIHCRDSYGSVCKTTTCPRQPNNDGNHDYEETNDNIELGNVENEGDNHGNAMNTTMSSSSSYRSTNDNPNMQQTNHTDNILATTTSDPKHPQHQQTNIIQKTLRTLRPLTACFHCLHPNPTTPHPVGIYLFLLGSLFAAITLATVSPSSTQYDLPLHFFGAPIVINALSGVTPLHWRQGFFQGALPQLPLTCLNSVISVCCLAHNLYPEKRQPRLESRGRTDAVVTRRDVAISVGLMNLLLCPLGSMPNCHGAGGLAGQHRFGARHGTSVVALGTMKMALAVFLGGSALTLLDALPVSVLGVMIGIAGLELVGTGVAMLKECAEGEVTKLEGVVVAEEGRASAGGTAKVNSKAVMRKTSLIAMVTASVIVALGKTHYGVIAGWVVHMIHGNGFTDLVEWFRRRRGGRRKDSREE